MLQHEIIHDIWVEKPSLYRVVMRYVNPGPSPIIGDLSLTPENPRDIPQHVKVSSEYLTSDHGVSSSLLSG